MRSLARTCCSWLSLSTSSKRKLPPCYILSRVIDDCHGDSATQQINLFCCH